ncbi:hypothetical protein TWF173_011529 [Orbilia oligospora]|nr:hypothetical protein TWF173_011529 [Orbilia oligospora]
MEPIDETPENTLPTEAEATTATQSLAVKPEEDTSIPVTTNAPPPASSSSPEIDYIAWDAAIVAAITSLPEADLKSRSQQFLSKHPTALSTFRSTLSSTPLAIPLAPFQQHPTFLLRFLLAEWRDEELKQFRTDLSLIISKSLERVIATQKWRSGDDECWKLFQHKDMDDLYDNFTHPEEKEEFIHKWFFQGFYGVDKSGHPVHYELLPSSYHEEYMTPLIIRRILNNEKTLRERVLRYNPPLGTATQEQLSNPKLGVTWILDARKISIAYVVNLGSVLVSLYNVAMKIMPAQTQRTTNCYGGRDVLDEVVDGDLPGMFGKGGHKNVEGLSDDEKRRQWEMGDAGPWVEVEA